MAMMLLDVSSKKIQQTIWKDTEKIWMAITNILQFFLVLLL